jgi:hypothetical protein
MKIAHESEIARYKERFEQLKYQYKPELVSECAILQDSLEECKYILERTSEIVLPVYEKFKAKNLLVHSDKFKYKELEIISYIVNLVLKFYNDNKYLLEVVSQQENQKKENMNSLNLPFVSNAITKNKLLLDIREDLYRVDSTNKESFQKLTDLMQFINTNFSEVVKDSHS